MRRPRGQGSRAECLDAFLRRKVVDASYDEIMTESGRGQFKRGSRAEGWDVMIWRNRQALFAKLSLDGSMPICGLDYHGAPGEIRIGYHWDVYPPLFERKCRCPIEPETLDASGALRLVCLVWNIVTLENQASLGLFDAR